MGVRRQNYVQVSGHVLVTYNVGMQNLTISETLKSLNDGEFHVVRFTRYGPNATLQVDDLPAQTRNPTGIHLTEFFEP
jgi:neurexin